MQYRLAVNFGTLNTSSLLNSQVNVFDVFMSLSDSGCKRIGPYLFFYLGADSFFTHDHFIWTLGDNIYEKKKI